MEPVYADFSADPPRLGNAFAAGADLPWPSHHGDHVILGNNQAAVVGFEVAEGDEVEQVTLTVTALTSKMGPRMGFAPLTIHVNGHAVVERLTIPGGGDLPQSLVYAVPGDWLLPGQRNIVEVRNDEDAATYLWLYRITMEEVFDRGAAERAMSGDRVREAVFTYRTEHRSSDEGAWTPGPELRIYIDRGEQSLPAQLSWGRPDGSECAISFQSAMHGFSGYVRTSDGTTHEMQGQLTDRGEFREGALGGGLLSFETEEGWGGGWHQSSLIRLAVGDGASTTPHRLAWRDQRGNSAAISVAPGGDSFLGYYQRYNEGPIGYRGQAVRPAEPVEPVKPVESAESAPAATDEGSRPDTDGLGHELEQIGKHARIAARQAADLVADWLKPRR